MDVCFYEKKENICSCLAEVWLEWGGRAGVGEGSVQVREAPGGLWPPDVPLCSLSDWGLLFLPLAHRLPCGLIQERQLLSSRAGHGGSWGCLGDAWFLPHLVTHLWLCFQVSLKAGALTQPLI